MRKSCILTMLPALVIISGLVAFAGNDEFSNLKLVRVENYADYARIVFELDRATPYKIVRVDDNLPLSGGIQGVRIRVDLTECRPCEGFVFPEPGKGMLVGLREVKTESGAGVFLDFAALGEIKSFHVMENFRVVIDARIPEDITHAPGMEDVPTWGESMAEDMLDMLDAMESGEASKGD